jgi:hypothetical protein
MLLQGGKKWVKRCGECEIVCNVYKFMKTKSAEATRVSKKTLCGVLKEGENVETGVAMAFSILCKLTPKACTKSISDNFDEAILRIVHNFYSTEKQRPTLKAIHSIMCESTGYGGGVSLMRSVLRKWDLVQFSSLNRCVL